MEGSGVVLTHEPLKTADSGLVDDDERGEAIRKRRLGHGIRSAREFAERTGLSRAAVLNAEAGQASEGTYQRLESWLDRFEEEVGDDEADLPQVITVELTVEGKPVKVTAPAGDPAALERAIAAIVRGLHNGGDPV